MAYKRKYSKKRYWKAKARGRLTRRLRKGRFAAKVKKVLMKAAETKFKDINVENVQLYHNLGATTLLAPGNVTSIAGMFNPWSTIARGYDRNQRIGDKIAPRGMSMKIYIANKYDRPNTMVRLIVCTIPKGWNGAVTSPIFFPFQVQTGLGNNLLLPCDHDKGVKFLYDRIHTLNTRGSFPLAGGAGNNKENTKVIKLWLKRKRPSDIVFDSSLQEIVNKPLAVYAIPYEQYSTIETDNIASIAIHGRMYYKDV